ncbi:MAG: ABC transporter permease [Xanthomonadaceae bacterium]|nr:ABC transporter permease [Xanthomonadaceae bacterium]MCC7249484.1 ABC transporter permease [Lysobacter sp.]
MNANALSRADLAAHHSPLRSYLLEARYEFLRLLRTPSFAIPSLLFPALFYLLFGVLLNKSNGDAARYLLATYGVFGVMGAGMFAFGVTVALERDQGFLIYKRALPMPPGAYLLAKMAMALLFAGMISILLMTIAATLGGVSLRPTQWALLFVVNLAGVMPFAALGLFIGSSIGGQGAPAVVNILYLPMAFLSGLWLPLKMLPDWIGAMAPVWPSYHHSQIALKVIGMDAGGNLFVHLGVLLGATVLFFALARRRLAA